MSSVEPWKEKFRIPLLKDHHNHPLFYAACMDGLNIRDAATKAEAIETIADRSKSDNELLVVLGWVESRYGISAEDLEGFGPVAVFNLSLHGLVLNSQAKKLLGELAGPDIENWADQEWHDRNFNKVLNCFAQLNGNVDRLIKFYSWLEQTHGVAYAEELLLVDENEITLYEQAGLLDRTRFWSAPDVFDSLSESGKSKVTGLKLFTDGALGVRTAALHEPYLSGGHGLLIYDDDQLKSTLQKCFATQKAVAIHAIGDKAIDQTVDALEHLKIKDHFENEVRIEHAQLISRQTAERAKSLGIILSMQPNFSMDSADYSDRLPQKYLQANNPFRMLIDEIGFVPGKDLFFGSDGMPHGLTEAVRASARPPFPTSQRLTLQEFVAGYCTQDTSKVQLEVSLRGDDVVFELVSE